MIQEIPQESACEIAYFRECSGGFQCQENVRNQNKENLELDVKQTKIVCIYKKILKYIKYF